MTAALVFGPKIPSTLSFAPSALSRDCRSETRLPVSPYPTGCWLVGAGRVSFGGGFLAAAPLPAAALPPEEEAGANWPPAALPAGACILLNRSSQSSAHPALFASLTVWPCFAMADLIRPLIAFSCSGVYWPALAFWLM